MLLAMLGGSTMRQAKKTSKGKKRVTKVAVPAFGAAGLTFSLAGAHRPPQCRHPTHNNCSTLDRVRLSRSMKRKWLTSASPPSISSTRKMPAAVCSWHGADAAVAAAAEAAGLAGPADVASVADVQVVLSAVALAAALVSWDAPYHARVAAHRGAAAACARPRRAPNGVSTSRYIIGRP